MAELFESQGLCIEPAARSVDGKTGEVKYGETDYSPPMRSSVAILFAGHWCPPCRVFTAKLASIYSRQLPIVVASCDRSAEERNLLLAACHPDWAAVRSPGDPAPDGGATSLGSARAAEQKRSVRWLQRLYGIRTIPALVVIQPDGKVITCSGRLAVDQGGATALDEWAAAGAAAAPLASPRTPRSLAMADQAATERVRRAAAQRRQTKDRARAAAADAMIAVTQAKIARARQLAAASSPDSSGTSTRRATSPAAAPPGGMRIPRIQLPPGVAAAGGKLQIQLPNGQAIRMVVPPPAAAAAAAAAAARGVQLQLRMPSRLPVAARPSWVGPLDPAGLTEVGDDDAAIGAGFKKGEQRNAIVRWDFGRRGVTHKPASVL